MGEEAERLHVKHRADSDEPRADIIMRQVGLAGPDDEAEPEEHRTGRHAPQARRGYLRANTHFILGVRGDEHTLW